MEKGNKSTGEAFFYVAIAGIFMVVICHSWLSDGMFLDGTMYAVLARNISTGAGPFWHLHFTNTLFPYFVEHPPLGVGFESILFRIFGDNRFVERFYSLLTMVITAKIIVSIWKELVKDSSGGWLPLLFWIIMPTVSWTSVNNMLENTLAIFICLSVLFYIKSQKTGKLNFLILAGFMISCGFLTKGLVTFTPLAFPFLFWAFSGKKKFIPMVSDTIIILISTMIPLALLYFFTGAHEFLMKFINMEINKIETVETSSSRFYILYRLVMELLPALGVVLVLLLYKLKVKLHFSDTNNRMRLALVFFALGMAGVLPILATMDQSTYFLTLSLPFFAISLGLIVDPVVNSFIERIDFNSNGFRIFKLTGIVMLVAGIVLSIYFSSDINRDRNKLEDLRVITTQIKPDSTINILPEMFEDWSLHAYYARYKNISLDTNLNNKHEYLLIPSSLDSGKNTEGFEKVGLKTKEYELFRRRN